MSEHQKTLAGVSNLTKVSRKLNENPKNIGLLENKSGNVDYGKGNREKPHCESGRLENSSSKPGCEPLSKNGIDDACKLQTKLEVSGKSKTELLKGNGENSSTGSIDADISKNETFCKDEVLTMERESVAVEEEAVKDFPNVSVEKEEPTWSADSDDEINEEDTFLFLEALKLDIEHNTRVAQSLKGYSCCLEKVDEDHEGDVDKDAEKALSSSCSFKGSGKDSEGVKDKSCCTTVETSEWSGKLATEISLSNQHSSIPKMSFSSDTLATYEKGLHFSSEVDKSEGFLRRVPSHWWCTDDAIATDIVGEIKNTLCKLMLADENPIISSTKNEDVYIVGDFGGVTNDHNKIHDEYDFTIEEIARILMNISDKIQSLPETVEKCDSSFSGNYSHLTLGQQYKILQTLANFECFLSDYYSRNNDDSKVSNFYEALSTMSKQVSLTFYFLSGVLNSAPLHLQNQPLSVLVPPESLTKTLAVFASIEYFRDCFISAIVEVSKNQPGVTSFDEVLTKMSMKYLSKRNNNFKPHQVLPTASEKELKTIKSFNLEEQISSQEVLNNMDINSVIHTSLEIRRAGEVYARTPGQLNNRNVLNCEPSLGFSSSAMTIQNVSDMFLLLSSVLNDVPGRLKSKKIVELSPPQSLLKALSVLYFTSEDDCLEVENRADFASLTVQDASDVFLTLSKKFKDVPKRLKDAVVADLDPPKSLVNAISLLTTLSVTTVNEIKRSEEVSVTTRKVDSQERFYDALDV